jgi:hypothetical protein
MNVRGRVAMADRLLAILLAIEFAYLRMLVIDPYRGVTMHIAPHPINGNDPNRR